VTPERVYQPRELRAVDAVALGLIAGAVLVLLAARAALVPRQLLASAMTLAGTALHLRVRREERRTTHDAMERTFE
jgi:hypothetical protein